MGKLGGTRFTAFLVYLAALTIVAIKAPTVIEGFGLWATAALTALITGKSWQHISNGKHSMKGSA